MSTSRLEFGSSRDEKYWERRRKNNVAAKKSRDARRVRENQLRLKVLCLENTNQVGTDSIKIDLQKYSLLNGYRSEHQNKSPEYVNDKNIYLGNKWL